MMRSWIAAAALLIAPLSAAQAQRENEDVHLRNRCRQAAHFLEMGPSHPHYQESLDFISSCVSSGGEALAARWRTIDGSDAHDLARLTYESARLPDDRVLEAATDLFTDATRPRAVRIALLRVLVSYVEPGRTLPLGAENGETPPEHCVLGSVTHFEPRQSTRPITADDHARIERVIADVAAADTDPVVRAAAACAATALQL